MPQDFKKYTNPMQDGRRKINPKLHDQIRERYKQIKSQRKVADEYGVTKNAIAIIVSPSRLKHYRDYCKGRWKIYADKEEHRLAMKKYRDKKRKLKIGKK
jgi:Zn-dependent peptidase ImmA (M78 family)